MNINDKFGKLEDIVYEEYLSQPIPQLKYLIENGNCYMIENCSVCVMECCFRDYKIIKRNLKLLAKQKLFDIKLDFIKKIIFK